MDLQMSNGNSFSNGQSMSTTPREVWWFRLMRPIQPNP
jgi:hypothetical protein